MAIQEISLRVPNRPGQIVRVLQALAREQINLAAISVDSTTTRGRVRLVVSQPDRAVPLLRDAGFSVDSRDLLAVQLEDRPGALLQALDLLARHRVNILSVAILVAREGGRTLVALGVSDPSTARQVLSDAGILSVEAERLITNADLLAVTPTIPSESVGLLL
jgi:hypothetical protein